MRTSSSSGRATTTRPISSSRKGYTSSSYWKSAGEAAPAGPSSARDWNSAGRSNVSSGAAAILPDDFLRLQAAPGAIDEALDRPKARLVGHLAAVPDPITQVQVGQRKAAALLDLPQDVVGAEARAGRVGVVERVDRGEPVPEVVDDRHHHELALVAEFNQPRAHAALQQEMRVLVAAVLVHSAAGVAARLVAQVKRVMLDAKAQAGHRGLQRLVRRPRAALAARGAKLLDGDAHRDAGAAVVAIGPVGEDAAAAKAEPHQVRVQLGADQVARGGDLRARHPAGQVAARVGRRHVELQYRMRQIVQLRHGSCTKDAPDQLPGERA